MVNLTGMGVSFKEQAETAIKETQSLHDLVESAHILEVRGALVGEVALYRNGGVQFFLFENKMN